MKNLLFVILCVLIAAVITGCSEIEDPVTTDFTADGEAFGTVGEMKMPADAAPGAPQLQIPEGTPTVKSVGYYSDWQLTKPLTGTVSVGKTIFIKVEFSEGMQLVVADDQTARPVLYRRVNGKLARFKIADFGAKGEDFVSGDAKPVKTKKVFLCKYTVRPEDTGEFTFAVGRLSADLQGNLIPAFYTHKEKLQCGPAKSPEPEKTDTTPPTVVSIMHYRDGTTLPEGESVAHNTTVETAIVFSEPISPESVVVTSTTGGKTKRYSYSTRSVHWRGTFQVSRDKRTVRCKQLVRADSFVVTLEAVKDLAGNALAEPVTAPAIAVTPRPVVTVTAPTLLWGSVYIHGTGRGNGKTEYKGITPDPEDFAGYVLIPKVYRLDDSRFRRTPQPIEGVTVTIIAGPRSGESVVTDEHGQYLFKDVPEDTLHLRVEGEHLETKEVIVHRSRPTALADGTVPTAYWDGTYRDDPQQIPGNILIGQRWPDAVRPLLQQVQLVWDPLLIVTHLGGVAGAMYHSGVAVVGKDEPHHMVNTLVHEIAHMWQHASEINGSYRNWEETPEGTAFLKARQQDWDEVGKARIDHTPGFSHFYNNAAEICAFLWTNNSRGFYGNLKITAPNRYKWAQEWFGK